jgi:hypothetical protein
MRQCFKIIAKSSGPLRYTVLHNQVIENPEQSHDMWLGQEETNDICTFLVDPDGTVHQGLFAETWEDAKADFRSRFEMTSEIDSDTVQAIDDMSLLWHTLVPSDLEL